MARESTLKNLTLTLLVITALSALGLGGMSVLTAKPIAQAKQAKILAALKNVLPPFDNDPSKEKTTLDMDGGKINIYKAEKDKQWVGSAVQTFTPKGFGGIVTLMVGFDAKGAITGYSVLEMSETPGLGTHMVDWFKPPKKPVPSLVERAFRFKVPVPPRKSNVYGMVPGDEGLKVSKDGGTVDAITAATISSRAFCDAINRAYRAFKKVSSETKAE